MSSLQLAIQDLLAAIASGGTVLLSATWEDTPAGPQRWVSVGLTRGLPADIRLGSEEDALEPAAAE